MRKGQLLSLTLCVGQEVLDNHVGEGDDVAMTPARIAHGRANLRDIQQLVDKCQERVALSDNHLSSRAHLTKILNLLVFQLLTDAQDHGEWRAELVCYISEKDLSNALCVAHHHLLGVSRLQVMPHEQDDGDGQ